MSRAYDLKPPAKLVFPLCLGLLLGCNMVCRRTLPDPGRNQVIRVESGERICFDLKENRAAGCQWDVVCTDSDVEGTIGHRPSGVADVCIRIHRGYDGPTDVSFKYGRSDEKAPQRQFTLSLYRRTGDCAFWE